MNSYAISSFNSDMWHHFIEDIISLSLMLCPLHSCRWDLINNLKSSVTRVQGIWVKCVSSWLVTSLFNLLSFSHVKHLPKLVNEQINVFAAEDMENCHQSSTPSTVILLHFFLLLLLHYHQLERVESESESKAKKSCFWVFLKIFTTHNRYENIYIGEKDVCDKYSSKKILCRLSCC